MKKLYEDEVMLVEVDECCNLFVHNKRDPEVKVRIEAARRELLIKAWGNSDLITDVHCGSPAITVRRMPPP